MNKQAKIITGILIAIALAAGILMLFWGGKGLIQRQLTIRGYEVVQGVLCDYALASEGGYDVAHKTHTSDTYYLIYRYIVDGQEYTIKTDYSTAILPTIGTEREIRYAPHNPQEAFIMGTDRSVGLLFVGVLFTVIPLFFILVFTGFLQRLSQKAFDIGIGVLLFVLGYAILSMITNSLSPVGILRYFTTSFSFPLLIPLLFLTVGLFQMIKSIIVKKGQSTDKNAKRGDKPTIS